MMAGPKKGTLAWFTVMWERRLAGLSLNKQNITRLAKQMARLSFDVACFEVHVACLEDLTAERAASEQSIQDLKVLYKGLAGQTSQILKRLGLNIEIQDPPRAIGMQKKAAVPFRKDGMVVVQGTPHLPECAIAKEVAMRRTRKRRMVPPVSCDCGSLGDREKAYSVN